MAQGSNNPNEALLERLNTLDSNISSLLSHFVKRGDRRIWEPDNSCLPFMFNGTASFSGAGAVGAIAKCKIPANHKAVITNLFLHGFDTTNNIITKWARNSVHFKILRLLTDSANPSLGDMTGAVNTPISIHGALQNVMEFPAGESSIIVAIPNTELFTRIILETGTYGFAFHNGGGALPAGHTFYAIINGYTFPVTP